MAWKDTLLDASFKGVTLHVIATDDAAERAQVRHEYPYRDGAEVEDLGRRARSIRLHAIVWGKDYESDLRKLLEALGKPGPGELIHPVFGSMNVSLVDHSVSHHAEAPDSARVNLDFVEAEPDAPFFAGGASTAAKALGNAGKVQTALDKLKSLNVSAVQGWAGKAASTLSAAARGDLLGAARGVFSEVSGLANINVPTMPNFLGARPRPYGHGAVAGVQRVQPGQHARCVRQVCAPFHVLRAAAPVLPQFQREKHALHHDPGRVFRRAGQWPAHRRSCAPAGAGGAARHRDPPGRCAGHGHPCRAGPGHGRRHPQPGLGHGRDPSRIGCLDRRGAGSHAHPGRGRSRGGCEPPTPPGQHKRSSGAVPHPRGLSHRRGTAHHRLGRARPGRPGHPPASAACGPGRPPRHAICTCWPTGSMATSPGPPNWSA